MITAATHPTVADLIRAKVQATRIPYAVAAILVGSLLLAATAQVSIPMIPVPITGQTFGVLLVGALLGSRRGALAVLAYIGEGLAGLPVFAPGSAGLTGPTGGYLIGFVGTAFVVGWLAERGWDRRIGLTLLAMTLGMVVTYAVGLTWLAIWVGGQKNALAIGLYPFLPGAAIKITLAALLLPAAWRWLGRPEAAPLGQPVEACEDGSSE